MDHITEALRAAGWTPSVLKRRLELFDLRSRGVPMVQCIETLKKSPRQVFYDWRAIRGVVATTAAPEIAEIRARIDARLERIFTLAMTEIANRAKENDKLPAAMLREARQAMVALGEMYGAIDRRPVVATSGTGLESLATKTDAELRTALKTELMALRRVEPDLIDEALAPNGNGH